MRLLILGGTKFIGRHIAQLALDSGHDVTLFNRGLTNPDAVPNARSIHGDRADASHLARLAAQQWDCVIDTSGYKPGDVELSAKHLGDVARRYFYISTLSVYPPDVAAGADERQPIFPQTEEIPDSDPHSYGIRKAQCERVLHRLIPNQRLTMVRPTIVVGPFDPTDRFTYWVRRVSRGGTVATPTWLDQPFQYIDVRDLAEFSLHLIADDVPGTFNTCAPHEPMTLRDALEDIRTTTRSNAEFDGVDGPTLKEHNTTLPFTVPKDAAAFFQFSNSVAIKSGMTLRPISESVSATLQWDRDRGEPPLSVGPDAQTEERLLSAAASR